MEQLFRLSINGIGWRRFGGVGRILRFAIRYIDLLIIPWILDVSMFFAYLMARSASLSIPLTLTLLSRKVSPQLTALADIAEQSRFRAAAARVNLGYLMVCGAVSIIVLSTVQYWAGNITSLGSNFEDILIWLIIGQTAPVLFGATSLLMHAVGRSSFNDVLHAVTALLFLVAVWALNDVTGVLVAQTFAVSQLTHAAICAVLLTQCGVWPGLTALFHKEIKLF